MIQLTVQFTDTWSWSCQFRSHIWLNE